MTIKLKNFEALNIVQIMNEWADKPMSWETSEAIMETLTGLSDTLQTTFEAPRADIMKKYTVKTDGKDVIDPKKIELFNAEMIELSKQEVEFEIEVPITREMFTGTELQFTPMQQISLRPFFKATKADEN